jgi:K(+)-stimulated pyrophosphate-energized sodium pump
MNIPSVFWLVPIASIVALGMAWFFFTQMMKEDEGTSRMKEIALYVRKGAMAYLWQQYKVVGIVFVVLCALFAFMAYGLNVQNRWVPFAFLTGGFFSGLAGFFGMKTATYASARTANAARQSLNNGLKVAFRVGGANATTHCAEVRHGVAQFVGHHAVGARFAFAIHQVLGQHLVGFLAIKIISVDGSKGFVNNIFGH